MGAPCSRPKNVGNPQVRTLTRVPTADKKNFVSNKEESPNKTTQNDTKENLKPDERYVDNKWTYLSPQKSNNKKEVASPERATEKNLEIVAQTKSTLHTGDNSFLSDEQTYATPKVQTRYKKGPLIGKGPSSEVYECLSLSSGELLALKLSKINTNNPKAKIFLESMIKEFATYKNLNHPNLNKYYGSEIIESKNDSLSVETIMEYISGGSVRSLIDKYGPLEEKIAAQYVRQVLKGLAYLHFNGIIHKDIKASNLLVDSLGKIKLTDYSFNQLCDPLRDSNSHLIKNSGFWQAPEIFQGKEFEKSSDLWSVGCTTLELLTGQNPWAGMAKNSDELKKLLNSRVTPIFPKDISENMRDFLVNIFQYEPDSRSTVLELLAHPLIKESETEGDMSQVDLNMSDLQLGDKSRMQHNTFKKKNTLESQIVKKPEIPSAKRVQLIDNHSTLSGSSPKKTEDTKQSYGNSISKLFMKGRLKTGDITLNTSIRELINDEFSRHLDTEKSLVRDNYFDHPSFVGSKKTLDSEFMTPRRENLDGSAIYEEYSNEMMYSTQRKHRRLDPQEIPIETPLSRKLREEKERKDQEVENERTQKKKLWELELQEELSRLNLNKKKL